MKLLSPRNEIVRLREDRYLVLLSSLGGSTREDRIIAGLRLAPVRPSPGLRSHRRTNDILMDTACQADVISVTGGDLRENTLNKSAHSS